jgi:hypothetical protein
MSTCTIHRAPMPADRYTIISNAFQRGELPVPLHALARVILGHLLTLPTGWVITRGQLDAAVLEGRDAVTTAIRELELTGYLLRDKRSGTGGQWSWTWQVTDDPVQRPLTGSPSTESQLPVPTSRNGTKPQVVPQTGIPSTGNQSVKEKTDTKKTDIEDLPADAGAALFPQPAPKRSKTRARDTTHIPDTWSPSPSHAVFARGNGLNVEWEANQFRDYWLAKGTTRADWDACFRTWLRNAVKFTPRTATPPARVKARTANGMEIQY